MLNTLPILKPISIFEIQSATIAIPLEDTTQERHQDSDSISESKTTTWGLLFLLSGYKLNSQFWPNPCSDLWIM